MASNGVTPVTGFGTGMTFPLTQQTTFGGPMTHYNNATAANFGSNTNNNNNTTSTHNFATSNDAANSANNTKTASNASLLQPQTLTLPHAASLVSSAPVPCGVIVAAATVGSLSIICSPFGPKQTLLFRQGQCVQTVSPLPDTPTCITLFTLPHSSTALLSAPATFQNGENTNNSGNSSLGFSLCCAVGTSSGNIYIYQISSKSGLPQDIVVSAVPTCVSERSLREAVDSTFAPATHKTSEGIVDVAGAYSNGIQMSVLAIATGSAGVIFVRLTKSDDGQDIEVNHVVDGAMNSTSNGTSSSFASVQSRVVSIRPVQNSKSNHVTNSSADRSSLTDENSSVAIFRRSSLLTFAICYDDGCIQMVDLRLSVTAANASDPQVSPLFSEVLPARDASRYSSIVSADVYVSSDRDVTSYSVEEGGSVMLNFISSGNTNNSNTNNNNNNNNNNSNTMTSTPFNREPTAMQTQQPQNSSAFGPSISGAAFNNQTSTNTNPQSQQQSSNNAGGRIAVPNVNTLSCLSSSQAVASSRNSLLLVSASSGNVRARYNTQNLLTLPFVINDLSVMKQSSAFSGQQVSRVIAGSGDSMQNYAPTGMTVAFVAADRNVSLVYVPL